MKINYNDLPNLKRDLDYAELDRGFVQIIVLVILLIIGIVIYAICF